MFLTRIGFGSKAVITGDVTQVDVPGGRNAWVGSSGCCRASTAWGSSTSAADVVPPPHRGRHRQRLRAGRRQPVRAR